MNNVSAIIKEKISLLHIIGQRVRITKKGNRYLGLCPFHGEKTPSFTVDESKGFYHCFGCNKSGDVFNFLMEYENLDFKEALEYLAPLAGINILDYNKNYSKRNQEEYKQKLDLLEVATNWFSEQLFEKENQFALEYILNRGFSKYTVQKFNLGYSPKNKDVFSNCLKNKGFTKEDAIKLGVILDNNYEVFKGRIIFPIKNKIGKIIAFGGRSLGTDMPKYLNSKDTELFHKKFNLYGLNESLKSVKNLNKILLVEGYLDVLAMQQTGFASVAPLGTAVSKEQLELLLKLKVPIYICLDGDEAGKKATLRAANIFLEILEDDTIVKIIEIPNKEDPDSYIKNNGENAFNKLVNESSYLSEFLWKEVFANVKDKNPEVKLLVKSKLKSYCNLITNKNVKDSFLKYFEDKINNSFIENSSLKNNNNQLESVLSYKKPYSKYYNKQEKVFFAKNTNLSNVSKNNLLLRDYYFLSYIIACPAIYNVVEQDFALLKFSTKELEDLKQYLVFLLDQSDMDSKSVYNALAKNGFNTILDSIMNNLLIKKALSRLKDKDDFVNAFYNANNRLLFDSLNNDIKKIKDSILQESENDENFNIKVISQIDKIKILQPELKKTTLFKGKL